jgi:hypothetical protein
MDTTTKKTREGIEVKVGQLWEGAWDEVWLITEVTNGMFVATSDNEEWGSRMTRLHVENIPRWWKLKQA